MTLIIVILLICGYLLIATGHLTGVNKAAIAMFLGTVGWVLYICWGADFVMSQHPREYAEYLAGEERRYSDSKRSQCLLGLHHVGCNSYYSTNRC